MDTVTGTKGAFLESLQRNNSQIRKDRATAIGEDTQVVYKRQMEDLEMALKRKARDQEAMLDLSPANALTLKPAQDFDPTVYVDADLAVGLEIRNLEIKLEIAKKRYSYLFGGV